MAIPLDQPVEEITRGVEGMKIGGNQRVPESAGKLPARKGISPSSPDVVTVQAHRLGYEHNGTEVVAQTQSPDAPATELGNLVPLSGGHVYVENSAVEQRANEAVEPVVFAAEQFAQGPYAGMTSFPLQTGYPALYMDPHSLYPYYMGGDIYNYPGASVYGQNYVYAVPGVDPYSVAYSGQYPYSQYQVGQVESFSVTPNSVPSNDDGAVPWELPSSNAVMLMPYGYQQSGSPHMENGQWLPMPLYAPTLMDGTAPHFDLIPYQAACVPEESNSQPAAPVPQSDRTKGPKVGDKTNFGEQLPSLKGGDERSRQTYTSSEGMDDKLLTVENKKPFKKQQLNLFYGSPMPTKESWLRSGHLHYLNVGHPLKDFSGKIRSSGTQVSIEDPLLKLEVNLDNFPLDFEEAKHFVIKSFSEENVMKSIQYGVWASTANGNKKLDEAFKDAQHRGFGKAKGCPVFLYFSVNGSGRFCGVAEMVGAVDYNNTMDFWERNRWCGSFPVKWHFIKDVPHSQLRRIILHNNENKPVTSSRDTQEVNYDQGMHMLSIIKGYLTKSSILDIILHAQRVPSSEVRVEERPPLEMRKERKVFPDKDMHQDAGCISEETHTAKPVISNGINTALRASNIEVKPRDAQLQVKQNVDTSIEGNIEGSGANNPDKENILALSVGPAVVL